MRTLMSLLTVVFVTCLLISCGDSSNSSSKPTVDPGIPAHELPQELRPPSMRDLPSDE